MTKYSAIYAEEAVIVDAQCALWSCLLKKKLKQKDLAERLGISEARISQMFADDANLSLRSLARAIHALGYSVELKVRKSKP